MLARLARLATERPRRVVLVTVLLFVVGGYFGGQVFDVVKPFGFTDPDSESQIAYAEFEEASGIAGEASFIALVDAGTPVERAAGAREVAEARRILDSDPAVARSISFEDGAPALISSDGEAAYILGFLEAGLPDEESDETVGRLAEAYEEIEAVTLGGAAVASAQIGEQVESDLARAELYAIPIIFLLSLLVFRSLVAALLPPLVGGLSIVGALFGLRLFAEVTDISVFAINLVTGLGLGLAIDYSLFIVSRWREEMAKSGPGPEAMRRTLATAGRTVAFSSLTVAVALAALLVFPQRFLYSMGLGGALVALIAGAVALTVLPAVLYLLGDRVNALAPARLRRSAEAEASGERGNWYRLSRWVMRHPGPIALATTAVMLLIGLPFLRADFTFADAKVLPESASARQVDATLDARFEANRATPLIVQLSDADPGDPAAAELRAEVAALDNVEEAGAPEPIGDGVVRISAVQTVEPFSEAGQESVREARAIDGPLDFRVAGDSADLVDQKRSLSDHLVIAVALIAITTVVLLFLMTGSVLLPIMALFMNLLTVSVAFGTLVLIFQDGRLEGLLDYESLGALDASQPILLFAVVFGLSTDYGVFLLTRIKEARDAGASDTEAVAIGLEKTGRIVTYAALLFCVAIGAFVTSEIIFLKQVGLGTAIGVLVDATIVRALLVPSLMRLLGRWSWWAPAPLRRVHARLGFSEA